jgi:hypothetical protein
MKGRDEAYCGLLIIKPWKPILSCQLSGDWYGLFSQGGKIKPAQHVILEAAVITRRETKRLLPHL